MPLPICWAMVMNLPSSFPMANGNTLNIQRIIPVVLRPLMDLK